MDALHCGIVPDVPSITGASLPLVLELVPQGWLGVDFHLHTRHSLDAFTRVGDLLEAAREQQIAVAITDHNEIRGALEAIEQPRGVTVIPGIEVKARDGVDVLVYFADPQHLVEYYTRVVEPKRRGRHFLIPDLSEEEIVDGARAFPGSLLIAPHPYAPGALGLGTVVESGVVPARVLEGVDAVEVRNATMAPAANRQAEGLCTRLRKPATGGSDAHVPWSIGRCLTAVDAPSKVVPILEAVRAGRCRALGQSEVPALRAATFFAGQARVLCQPGGVALFRHNFQVFVREAPLREGNLPKPPAALSLLRLLVLSPLLALALSLNWLWWGLLLLVVGFASDALDGVLSRRLSISASRGQVLDQLADAAFVSAGFIGLALLGAVPPWLVGLSLATDVLAVGSQARVVSLGRPLRRDVLTLRVAAFSRGLGLLLWLLVGITLRDPLPLSLDLLRELGQGAIVFSAILLAADALLHWRRLFPPHDVLAPEIRG